MRFVMDGEMPEYLLAKDLILQVGRQGRAQRFRTVRWMAAGEARGAVGRQGGRGILPLWAGRGARTRTKRGKTECRRASNHGTQSHQYQPLCAAAGS